MALDFQQVQSGLEIAAPKSNGTIRIVINLEKESTDPPISSISPNGRVCVRPDFCRGAQT